jgi:hypothetical protein
MPRLYTTIGMASHDPAASAASRENETISETASFVQHYFDEGELAAWFSRLKTALYEEVMKYDDSHGEPHYHGLARLIGRKSNECMLTISAFYSLTEEQDTMLKANCLYALASDDNASDIQVAS